MSNGRRTTRRVRILVKAFPQPSKKYEETVCCAGITEDRKRLLRLYPIRFRHLEPSKQFDRFDLVEMAMQKPTSDPRPESYHVDEASIRILKSGKKVSAEERVKFWARFIAPSLTALREEQKSNQRSLGIVRPNPDSVRFVVKPAAERSEEDQEVSELVYKHQLSLLEPSLKTLEKPKFSLYYRFTSDGHEHNQEIHDWEVQAAFFNYRKRYGSEAEAVRMLTQEYETNIPGRNLHLIMGTMQRRPWQFIIIGLLRSGIDPADIGKQHELF